MRLSRTKCTAAVVGALVAGSVAIAAPVSAATPNYVPLKYNAAAKTFLNGQADALVTFGPTTFTSRVDANTNKLDQGTLTLPPAGINLLTPDRKTKLRATITFTQAGDITGSITRVPSAPGLSYSAAIKANYSIKLSLAAYQDAAGQYQSLNLGSACRTATPTTLNLATEGGKPLDLYAGGDLYVSKYSIGSFTGCNTVQVPGSGAVSFASLVSNDFNIGVVKLTRGSSS